MMSEKIKYLGWLFLLLLCGSFLFYFISQSFYFDDFGNLKTFSWTLNADWMMHMAQVQAFSELDFLYVIHNNPIYSGDILAYPFFVNWLSGMILSVTGNLVFSMLFPVYLGALLFLSGIYFLVYQLTKNVFIAFLTPIVFFFLAGAQAYFTLNEYNLFSEHWANLKDYEYDLNFLGKTAAEMGLGSVFNWKSFFLTTFIPQRSFIWGMGIGTLFLAFFVKQQNAESVLKNSFRNYVIYCFIGLGVGLLSFIHTHTFFYFFFLFLVLFFLSIFSKKNIKECIISFKNYFSLALGALVTSSPFLYLLAQKKGAVSEFSLFPFGENVNIFEYLVLNWGIVFLLGLLLLIPYVFKSVIKNLNNSNAVVVKNNILYHFLLASAVLLIVFSIWQLQSNPWDNTKVLLWSGLFFSMSASMIFVYLWKNWGVFGKIYAIVLFCVSVISGIIMCWSGVDDENYQVFSVQELENAKEIKSVVKPNELILTSDYFQHFISPLLANPIFMGYRGWIGSYGMDWSGKVETAKIIYSGGKYAGKYKKLTYQEVLQIIKEENIDYIFVDNSASMVYEVEINYAFFHRYFEKIVDLENRGVLYKKIGN